MQLQRQINTKGNCCFTATLNLRYHLKDKQNHSAAVYHVTSAGQKRKGIHARSVQL